ncbi:peptide deformylase [Yeosuana sp.]|uniref:peptide deformylase n=1 Tax=Yeosuana sp. TaxID=2529388 RepID=UPI0040551FCE
MKKALISVTLLVFATGCISIKINQSNNEILNPFSREEMQLIEYSDALAPMRIYKITNKNDSIVLRKQSGYIKPDANNPILQTFVKRLYRTVTDSLSLGVGIAAPQVGILKNIIWVQRFDKENFPFEVYLNPTIIQYSQKKQTFREGCLSIPNRTDILNDRAYAILIEYDMLNGEHKTEMIEDFTSVIFQHEIDHLNGILYLDHLEKEVKDAKEGK